MFTVNVCEAIGKKRNYTGLHYRADNIREARLRGAEGIRYAAKKDGESPDRYVAQILNKHGLLVEEIS